MRVVKFFLIFISLFCISFSVSAYDKNIVDVTQMTVLEIQEAVDDGYLTYEKLMTLYLDRIDAYNEKYNALISINENALEEARKCDEIYQTEGRKGILFGIPIILKDNIDYISLPTTNGTLALKDSFPDNNAEIVDNLIENGAIILGKSNMSEFAFSAIDSYSSYGHVRNAYNIEYTSYGSSGGSAVSVAVSFAPLSIGTDTNSSIRLPASANNVIGLRPTQGLLSNKGIISYDFIRDTAGPISKTVEDNAILLTVLANNGIDYTKSLKKDGLKGKNIGVLVQFYTKDESASLRVLKNYYDEIEYLMKEAINKMEQAGANIIYIYDFYDYEKDYYYDATISGAYLCNEFNKYIINTSSKYQSFSSLVNSYDYVQNLAYYEEDCNASYLNENYYNSVIKYKQDYQDLIIKEMEEYDVDVLIYPTTKDIIPKINELNSATVATTSYTIAPTAGLPSISMPLGFDSNNLPYGFEILTLPNREDLLYEIAYSYEQIDNELITPDIAPTLYDIPDILLSLKELYENTNINLEDYSIESVEKFNLVNSDVENVLFNYNEYEGTDADIQSLYIEYEDSINKLELKNNDKFNNLLNNKKIVLIIIGIIIMLCSSIIIKIINKLRNI